LTWVALLHAVACRRCEGDFVYSPETLWIGNGNCTSITGALTITKTPCPFDLDGLSALTSVGGDLTVRESCLRNVDGLSALTSVGGTLRFSSPNYVLQNVDGLSALTSVGGHLVIQSEFPHWNGLSALTSVGGALYISWKLELQNLDGLSALTSVGGLYIGNNVNLQNVDGLSALTSVGGANASLGWSTIGPGGLRITGNNDLQSLNGLSALTSVEGDILIRDNAYLQNLDGLCALSTAEAADSSAVFGDITVQEVPSGSTFETACPSLSLGVLIGAIAGSVVGVALLLAAGHRYRRYRCPPQATGSGEIVSATGVKLTSKAWTKETA